MKILLLAFQFLTIIPVRVKGAVTEKEVGRSGLFFPLVGTFQGVIGALAMFLLVPLFSVPVACGLVVFILIATNGGFHLDGLADTFDAIAVKSTGNRPEDRQKRLSVMKDSATGAIGVTAIVMAVLLKYLLVSSLFEKYDATSAVYLVFLMPLFSKWSILPVMFHGKPARNEGLGRIFVDGTTRAVLLLSTLLFVVIYVFAALLSSMIDLLPSINFLIVSGLSLYAFSLLWSLFCSRRFGGLTGDTIGAAGEIGDLLFLAIASLWF
jgi:adenosylcobinamide-GDP ribazoletransferase